MKTRYLIFLVCVSVISWAAKSYAGEINSEQCNGCNTSTMYSKAINWAHNNIPPGSNEKKLYHVIDVNAQTVITYEVSKRAIYNHYAYPPGYVYQPVAITVNTPSNVSAKTTNLFYTVQTLKGNISNLVIPSSVINSPWEITNCAYCANDVGDYIRQNGDLNVHLAQFQAISAWLGLTNGNLFDTYTLSLEAGGEIVIKLSVTEASVLVEVLSAKDVDNNNVPLVSTNLSGTQIRIYYNSPAVIDHYLVKFGFRLTPSQTGIVTIEECRRPHDTPSSLPNCL